MVRPAVSEWESVFGFSDDPTPGDVEMLGNLAGKYRSVANDAGDALPLVSQLENQEVGEGKSMEKLREKLGELAEQVRKLHSSYDEAASALSKYTDHLEGHQKKADNALDQGRQAKERLTSATEVVLKAGAEIGRLDGAPDPDGEGARRSAEAAMTEARDNQSSGQADADDAQAELDAARMLAEDAREMRETDAAVAAQALVDARGEAVPGKSLWEKIRDVFSLVLGIISGVLGVLAMLIPGLQGLGLALMIGSVMAGAAAFGINLSKMAENGEWDPIEIVLGIAGLALGGAAIFKSAGGIASALKGIRGKGEFGKIPQAFKNVPNNMKNLGEDIVKSFKNLAFAGSIIKNPSGALGKILANPSIANMFRHNLGLGASPLGGIPGAATAALKNTPWARDEVAGFFFGVTGLIYGPTEFAKKAEDHKVPDSSYLPGT